MAAKRIGILTGGGDVPGLNSVIKTVVYRGSEIGCEVIGIRRGWEGLTHVNLQDPASRTRYVLPLNRENTRTIDRTGGTYLHSSRTNPSKMKKLPPVLEGQDFPVKEFTKKGVTSKVFDVTKAVLKNIQTLNLDYLIAIGADDTLSYSAELAKQGSQLLSVLSERGAWVGYNVKEYGEADAFGHRKKMSVAEGLSNEIKNATGEETIVSDLTYDLRSGSADFVDRMVASTFAGMAMDAIAKGQHGLMTAISNGCFTMVGIPDPKLRPRRVDIATMYNTEP